MPMVVDYEQEFPATDHNQWQQEYQAKVIPELTLRRHNSSQSSSCYTEESSQCESLSPQEIYNQIQRLENSDRQALLDELLYENYWYESGSEVRYE